MENTRPIGDASGGADEQPAVATIGLRDPAIEIAVIEGQQKCGVGSVGKVFTERVKTPQRESPRRGNVAEGFGEFQVLVGAEPCGQDRCSAADLRAEQTSLRNTKSPLPSNVVLGSVDPLSHQLCGSAEEVQLGEPHTDVGDTAAGAKE